MGQPRSVTVVRLWPADNPATELAARRAAAAGQLVDARWTVRRGRPVLRVVLVGQAVARRSWVRSSTTRRTVAVVAAGAGAAAGLWGLWQAALWGAAHLTEIVSWLVTMALAVFGLVAFVRWLLGR